MSIAAHSQTPLPLSGHPHLFLDDVLIADRQNLQRDLKQPVKHPDNPLIVQEHPWEERMMNFYGTVLYAPDRKRYQCWYLAGRTGDRLVPGPGDDIDVGKYCIAYAESDDGLAWEKPMVGRGRWGPHAPHNIVMPGAHGLCVLREEDEPDPARRYKAAGGAQTGYSPDGIRWQLKDWKYAVGKNDTSPSVVRWKGSYYAYVRNQEGDPDWPGVMRGIGLCTSKDFDHWTPKESILRSDETDGYPWVQPHALAVTAYGDVLIGLLVMVHVVPEHPNNAMGDMDVQLVVSRDGRTWNRVADRAVFLSHPRPEPFRHRAWDLRCHPGGNLVLRDDEIRLYYVGCNNRMGEATWEEGRLRFGHPGAWSAHDPVRLPPAKWGIGLATLPADRFVSLRPVNWMTEGILETQPLVFAGDRLLVNADVHPDNLRVELLDEHGRVLPGFDWRSATAVVANDLRFEIHWGRDGNGQSLANAPRNRPLRLRILIRDGDLFAFQVPTGGA